MLKQMIRRVREFLVRPALEEALRDSEDRFKHLAQAAALIPWEADPRTWTFTFVGAQAEDILGFPVERWYEPNFWTNQIHPADREWALNYCAEWSTRRDNFDFVYRMRNHEGKSIWLHDFVNVLSDEEGPTLLRGFMIDVTEQKRAEEALRRSETKFRAMFESSRDALGVSRRGIHILANPAYVQMFGCGDAENLIGTPILDLIAPSEHEKVTNIVQARARGEYAPDLYETLGRRKDGSEFEMETHVSTYTMDEEVHTFVILRDITDRKKSEEALRRAQKMEAIGRLTGGIAHDFNNMLGVILGNLELLELQTSDTESRSLIASGLKSAKRAGNLTKQLLGFARRQPAHVAITDINRALLAMENLIARAITPEVHVDQNFARDLWPAKIDPGDFEDALLNLIINARDAMPAGGRLTLETLNCTLDQAYCDENPGATPGQYVRLTVSDSGTGIAREHSDRIFEPFFSTKPPGEGTGLGLALVFGFVERSAGHIQVFSEPGRGAAFQLYLPRAGGDEQTAKDRSTTSGAPAEGHETVLVVDDEEGYRILAQKSLTALGYRVLAAADGRQALEKLAADPVDLLFTDVVMPGGINGYELAEKAIAVHADLKVLLTSGYSDNPAPVKNQIASRGPLLAKPYAQADLANRVRIMLDKQNAGERDSDPLS